MDSPLADEGLAQVAASIAAPARARMLCCLLDGRARTATELAAIAEISASTASSHLSELRERRIVDYVLQGKHRYYRLGSADVAAAIEALLVVAGTPRTEFVPSTPERLRLARTCYDHLAGTVAVELLETMRKRGWLRPNLLDLTEAGTGAMDALGVDLDVARKRRRRFAGPCLDWSERRPHLGGALGAALLELMVQRAWVERELEGRELTFTSKGRRELANRFGISMAPR